MAVFFELGNSMSFGIQKNDMDIRLAQDTFMRTQISKNEAFAILSHTFKFWSCFVGKNHIFGDFRTHESVLRELNVHISNFVVVVIQLRIF